MHFHVKGCHNSFKKPTKAEKGSVGYDLYAVEDGFIDPLSRSLVGLGFCASFTLGYVGLLLDRSGMGNKGIHRFGGVIDPTYRGEWKVILYNSTASVFEYKAGDRLVQVVFMPVENPEVTLIEGELELTERVGGFGSTGR